jgi:hypothetical protein
LPQSGKEKKGAKKNWWLCHQERNVLIWKSSIDRKFSGFYFQSGSCCQLLKKPIL